MPSLVAFQGHLGAYSHLACTAACPDHQVLPCGSFDEAMLQVEQGDAELAMLPVENSRAGRVTDVHRLLPERSLHIIGEHYQPVHHQLLAPPGTRLTDLREVHSHPQALAQTRQFLERRGLEAVAARDTAGAARMVAELGDPSIGAIASSLAAEIYHLEVMAPDVEDERDNTTRFLVMARDPRDPPRDAGPLVTSCLFRVRNIPAALYKALGGFATNGVNLLKLESYQLGGFHWAMFAIDVEGHPSDPSVRRALEELRYFSADVRVLGTYLAQPYRARCAAPVRLAVRRQA